MATIPEIKALPDKVEDLYLKYASLKERVAALEYSRKRGSYNIDDLIDWLQEIKRRGYDTISQQQISEVVYTALDHGEKAHSDA